MQSHSIVTNTIELLRISGQNLIMMGNWESPAGGNGAQNRSQWRQSVPQCTQLDAG